jgi:hypothetical protein
MNDGKTNGNNGNDGKMKPPLFLAVQEILRLLFILEWIFVRIVDKHWERLANAIILISQVPLSVFI